MPNIGTITDGYLYFNAEAGKTYKLSIENTNGEFTPSLRNSETLEWDTSEFVGGNAFDGTPFTFTVSNSFPAKLYLDGGNILNFEEISNSIESIDSLINDALASVKTYVDSKDASVKAYADALIAQLMQTTDLAAKIALLNQVNDILDGDAATAGFQLWEANVAKLNQVVADLAAETLARSNAITASQNALQTSINSKSTEINARIDSVVSSLNTEITAKTTTLDSGVTANFVAMKAKAAIIFAV
jgi:hypothetical protein